MSNDYRLIDGVKCYGGKPSPDNVVSCVFDDEACDRIVEHQYTSWLPLIRDVREFAEQWGCGNLVEMETDS